MTDDIPKFDVGSVVMLRSSGPSMTVYLVTPMMRHLDHQLYEVCWFDGNVLMRDSFSEPEIEQVTIRAVR